MANEFKHKDPGTELTQAEFIAACGDGHIFACQATGDIVYASSATVLSKLARGAANTVLSMGGSCIPAWTASPSVTDLTIGGGCITLSAATDIDLLDNNASALSFDATGKTGIIDIVTTNCSEGVTMSGTLGVTGVLTATGGLAGGAICIGSNTITTTGLISGGSLDVDDVLINGSTIGHTCDTDLITVADQSVTIAGDLAISGGCITLTGAATDIDLIDNNACALSFDASGQAGILAIDTQNCAEGVKMSGKLTVTGAISTTGALTVGACDTGLDVKFFGASAGAYVLYDQSEDQLEIRGASADATTSTGKLLLSTSLTNVNANDVIGSINFQAPAEAGGTDAVAIAAGIRAVAQATFTCAVNSTDLIFYTGHSEAATEKFRFTSQGEIGIGGANYGTDGQVLTSGGAGAAPAWEDAAGGVGCGPLRIANGAACAPAYSFSGDTNSGFYHTGTADTIELIAGGGGSLRLDSDSKVYIKDCANSKLGRGLTIQGGGYDNEIFSLKSSDVDHKLTTDDCGAIGTETDTFFAIKKNGATYGGACLMSWTTGNGIYFRNHVGGSGWTSHASNQGASFQFMVYKHDNCNSLNAMSADTNLLAIGYVDGCGGARRFLFDKEGTAHADVGTATYDDYCDVELLRGLLATTCDQYKQNYVDKFGEDLMYNQQWYEDNKLIGKCSIHYETRPCGRIEQRAMVNMTGLAMLHHSTIIQLSDRVNARLDGIETQLKALTEGK